MPQLPVETTQDVFADPTQARVTATAGDALGGLGRAIGAAGDAQGGIVLAQQGLKNETDAKEADITLGRTLDNIEWNPDSGYRTKFGKDAVDGYKPAQDAVTQAYRNTRATLNNPLAQQMFDQVATRRVIYTNSSIGEYAAMQNKQYQVDTSNARIKNEVQIASNYANDDTRFTQATNTIKDEVDQQAGMLGWSSDQKHARQTEEVGKAWTSRISRIALQDPFRATDMYRQNIDAIPAEHRDEMERYLKGQTDPQISRGIVDSVILHQAPVTTDAAPLVQAVRMQESGGDQSAVSPKGAAGVMQLTDAAVTDAARSLGETPDLELYKANTKDGEAYNDRMGRQYLHMQLARYGGNQSLALAAYNGGPTRLDAAIAKGGSTEDILARMPKETQDYVTAINGKAPGTPPTPATSMDPRAHLPEWETQVSAAAEAARPGDLVFRDQAVSELRARVGAIYAAQEGQQRDAHSRLLLGAFGNGDIQNTPKSLEQLLSNPQAKADWAVADPAVQVSILERLEHNAKDLDVPATPAAMDTYYRLRGEAAETPDQFKNEDLSKYVGQMPRALVMKLMDEQTSVSKKAVRDSAQAQTYTRGMRISLPVLAAAGINPDPKKGTSQAKTLEQFKGRFTEAIDNFYTSNKRDPDDKEIKGITNELLTQGAQAGTAGWFSGDRSVRAFQADPNQFYVPPPKAEVPKITQAFRARFHRDPTPVEASQVYATAQARKKSGG